MNYVCKLAFALLLLSPAPALAHPGGHSAIPGLGAALWHLLSQPDHALMLMGAVLTGVYVYRKIRRASL